MAQKIAQCRISAMPDKADLWGVMPTVSVKFEDGTEKDLFQFYPDEISFNEQEFIGLTEDEARTLKFNKDKKYLQS